MFNKKIIFAILLISIFAVGTLNFAGTVNAAKWKQFDSGKMSYKNMDKYQKNFFKPYYFYTGYVKGDNRLYANFYYKTKKTNKVYLAEKISLTKSNNDIMKLTYTYYVRNEKSTRTYESNNTIKQEYNLFKKAAANLLKVA